VNGQFSHDFGGMFLVVFNELTNIADVQFIQEFGHVHGIFLLEEKFKLLLKIHIGIDLNHA
jgi:hypothetical protein